MLLLATAAVIFRTTDMALRTGQATVTVTPTTTYQTWRYNMMLLGAVPAWGAVEPTANPAWDRGLKSRLTDQLVNQLGINAVQLTESSGDIENNRDCWTASNITAQSIPQWYACRYAPVSAGPDVNKFYCEDTTLVSCPQSWPMAKLDFQYEKYILGANGMAALLRTKGERLHIVFQYIHWPDAPTYLDESPVYVGRQVVAAFLHIRNKFGTEAVPEAVDMMVEPDGHCATGGPSGVPAADCHGKGIWNYTNLGRAAAAVADGLRGAGFPVCSQGGTRVACIQIWAPSTWLSADAVAWYVGLKAVAGPVFTGLTTHWYDGAAQPWDSIRRTAEADGICPVMTELVPMNARNLYDLVAKYGVCGVEKYGPASVGASDSPSSYLTITSVSPYVSHYVGNSWFLPQFMEHMREGDVREAAESDNDEFMPLAFRAPNGREKVIVSITAAGHQTIRVKGLAAGRYGCTYTYNNATLLHRCGPDQAIAAGGVLRADLQGVPQGRKGQITAVVSLFAIP